MLRASYLLSSFVAVMCFTAPLHSAAPTIGIRQMPEKKPVKEATVIPFVADTSALSWTGAPVVQLNDSGETFGADIWFAATIADLRVHAVVRDSMHENKNEAWMVWTGDALMVGVNPRAVSVLEGENDDAAQIEAYGLTARGPDGWAGGIGKAIAPGTRKKHIRSISRDDTKGLTTYDIAIPWHDLRTAPGYESAFGISVMVRDFDRHRELQWGHNSFNVLSGAKLKPVTLAGPAVSIYGLTSVRDQLPRVGDTALFVASWSGQAPTRCVVEFMGEKSEAAVRSAGAGKYSRVSVTVVPPPDFGESQPVRITLLSAKGDTVYTSTAEIERPSAVVAKVLTALDRCIEGSSHPLLVNSYHASKAIVHVVWLTAQQDPGSDFYNETLRKCQRLHDELQNIGTPNWRDHATGIRPLMRVFRSEYDNSLQPYHYLLPYPYDSTKSYPLVVDLHAYSDHHPLVANVYADPTRDTANLGDKGKVFTVYPWARGNLFYEEAGAADVISAMDDFCLRHKVDPDRVYLTGTSMGGYGTWSVGARTPDRWAALCPKVSWYRYSSMFNEVLMRNVKGLPVLGFAGENDRGKEALLFEKRMKELGNTVEIQIGKGMGHEVPMEFEKQSLAWMLQQKRVKRTSGTFVADDPRLNTCYGIQVYGMSGEHPEFTFAVKGSVLTIDTKRATRLSIWLGKDGVGLKNPATVVLNGKEAYRGEPKRVDLDIEQQPTVK